MTRKRVKLPAFRKSIEGEQIDTAKSESTIKWGPELSSLSQSNTP